MDYGGQVLVLLCRAAREVFLSGWSLPENRRKNRRIILCKLQGPCLRRISSKRSAPSADAAKTMAEEEVKQET